jgi:hypothetical protein
MHQLLAERLTVDVDVSTPGGKYRLPAGPGHGFRIDDEAVGLAHERFLRDGRLRHDRVGSLVRLAIRGGTVVDGTGAPGRRADLLVEDGRIADLGSFDAEAFEIDATGMLVAPGFVDLHSHSDYTLLVDPRAVSAIHQGVTTEVVGNCGFGCFPIRTPRSRAARSTATPTTFR